MTPKAAAIPLISVADAVIGSGELMLNNEKVIELLVRVRRLEQRQKYLIISVVFIVAFAAMLGYFTPKSKESPMPPAPNSNTAMPTPSPVVRPATPFPAPAVKPIKRSAPSAEPQVLDPATQPML